MKRLWSAILILILSTVGTAIVFGQAAPIIGALPFTLTNGTVADANQVMANFNFIVSSVNNNAANAGANSNITSLTGLTTPLSPSSGGTSTYYGGTSSGGNAYVVSSPTPLGFTLTAGRSVIFTVNATNTGASTLNVNSTGVTNIFKSTPSGPAALSGGELVAGNAAIVTYDGTQYQCVTCNVPSLVPAGTTIDYSGVSIPAGWLIASGQVISRTTFSSLFAALTITTSATTNSTSTVAVPNSALFQVGWAVGGNNVTCNSIILSIPDGTHITLNTTAGATGATTLTIGPYSQGDCSTTFQIPNYNGRVLASVDQSSGTINLTCTNPNTVGDKASFGGPCGSQVRTLTAANIPSLTLTQPGITVTVSGSSGNGSVVTTNQNVFGISAAPGAQVGSIFTQASTTERTTISASASGAAYTNTATNIITVQPTSVVYKLIKT